MKPAFRKVLAALSVALGTALVVLELRGADVGWFWVIVGGGLVVLGMLELLSKEPSL